MVLQMSTLLDEPTYLVKISTGGGYFGGLKKQKLFHGSFRTTSKLEGIL